MNKVVIIIKDGRVDNVLTPYPEEVDIEIIDLDTDVPEERNKAQERATGFLQSPDYLIY